MDENQVSGSVSSPSSSEMNTSSETQTESRSVESSTSSESTSSSTNTSGGAENRSTSDYGSNSGNSSEKATNGYALTTDANGRRVLKPISDAQNEQKESEPENSSADDVETETTEPTITEEAQNVQTQIENSPTATYTLDEFSNAIAMGQVDEARVPAEYQQQYANYKINLAVNAYNQQMEAQRQAQEAEQARVQAQLNPEYQQEQRKEFLTRLEAETEARAKATAGLTDEDIDGLEFLPEDDPKKILYNNAKTWHRQELLNGLQARAASESQYRQAQAAVYQGINDYVNKAKVEEPNFGEIDKIMLNRYKNLPYQEGRKVEDAINALKQGSISEQQSVTLREYYEATRKEYYAKKNGLSTTPKPVAKPPVVERAGDGRGVEEKYSPDFSKLANSNLRGRRAWIAEFLRNKGE